MKMNNLLFATAVMALLATGCYTRREVIHEPAGAIVTTAPAREVVIVQSPPAPQAEVMGVAPSPNHVWMPGHWTREGDRWVWMSGRWDLRPDTKSVYVPGHWEKSGGGYIWREGYWK